MGSPSEADIVIELQYRPLSTGSSGYGVYNPYSKTMSNLNPRQGVLISPWSSPRRRLKKSYGLLAMLAGPLEG